MSLKLQGQQIVPIFSEILCSIKQPKNETHFFALTCRTDGWPMTAEFYNLKHSGHHHAGERIGTLNQSTFLSCSERSFASPKLEVPHLKYQILKRTGRYNRRTSWS